MPRSGSQDPFPWLGPHRYGAREPCPRSAPVHARIDLDLPLFLWGQLLADADHAGYRVMTCLAQLARCRLGLLGPREPAGFPAIQVHRVREPVSGIEPLTCRLQDDGMFPAFGPLRIGSA